MPVKLQYNDTSSCTTAPSSPVLRRAVEQPPCFPNSPRAVCEFQPLARHTNTNTHHPSWGAAAKSSCASACAMVARWDASAQANGYIVPRHLLRIAARRHAATIPHRTSR
jgi:hypothetical protein